MDLEQIYLIDSLSHHSSINDEDESVCKHQFIFDPIVHYDVCSKCGFVNTVDKIPEISDSVIRIDSNYLIDTNRIMINKLRNPQLRQLYRSTLAPNYTIKAYNKDIMFINDCCEKLEILKIIADDAKLLYYEYKSIVYFNNKNKFISKSTTKKQRVNKANEFVGEGIKDELLYSDCKVRGNSRLGILAACIYYACFKNNRCILINKIAEAADIKPRYVHTGCAIILKLRDQNISSFNILLPSILLPYPSDYAKSVAYGMNIVIHNDGIDLTQEDNENIKKILMNMRIHNVILNHNPHSIATGAALYYLISRGIIKLRYPRKCFCEYFGISQPTINSSFKEIIFNKKILDISLDKPIEWFNEQIESKNKGNAMQDRFNKNMLMSFMMKNLDSRAVNLSLIQKLE